MTHPRITINMAPYKRIKEKAENQTQRYSVTIRSVGYWASIQHPVCQFLDISQNESQTTASRRTKSGGTVIAALSVYPVGNDEYQGSA